MIQSYYLSHGAPPLLEEENEFVELLQQLRKQLSEASIDLIVVASPHWISRDTLLIQNSSNPACIQDYYGFPDRFYEYNYQVPGDPQFADMLIKAAHEEHLPVEETSSWGLDHGAWVPLYLLFPEKNIPVLPISSGKEISPEIHFRWGEVIREVALKNQKDVLFLGTGSPTHRLDQIRWQGDSSQIFHPGKAFDEQLIQLLKENRTSEILGLENSQQDLFSAAAPEGQLKSLFIALGVAGEDVHPKILSHQGWHYGVSLLAVEFV